MNYAAAPRLRSQADKARQGQPAANFFLKAGGVLFVAVWTLTLLGGAWDYLFKRLLHAPAPSVTLLTLLVLALFSLRLFNRNSQLVLPVPDIVAVTWVFAAFLLLSAMVNANTQLLNVLVILLSFHVYYFYVMFFAASPLLAGSVSSSGLAAYLVLLGLSMAAIGIAQAIAGDLFSFGYYITSSISSINVTTAGRVRASAFFTHADNFGIFLCIPLAVAIQKFFLLSGFLRRAAWMLIALVLIAGCVATLTRAVYIVALLVCVLSWWGARRLQHKREYLFPKWTPLLLLALALSLFSLRYVVESFLMNVDALKDYRYLMSAKSLDERIYGSLYYVERLSSEGLLAWMLGLGWAFASNAKALVPIDNGFLAIVVSSGVFGLCVWLWLSWRCWLVLNRLAATGENALGVPFAAYFCAWLAMAVFGLYLEPFMVAVLLVATLSPELCRRIRA